MARKSSKRQVIYTEFDAVKDELKIEYKKNLSITPKSKRPSTVNNEKKNIKKVELNPKYRFI